VEMNGISRDSFGFVTAAGCAVAGFFVAGFTTAGHGGGAMAAVTRVTCRVSGLGRAADFVANPATGAGRRLGV
jgi:hypothetical protein